MIHSPCIFGSMHTLAWTSLFPSFSKTLVCFAIQLDDLTIRIISFYAYLERSNNENNAFSIYFRKKEVRQQKQTDKYTDNAPSLSSLLSMDPPLLQTLSFLLKYPLSDASLTKRVLSTSSLSPHIFCLIPLKIANCPVKTARFRAKSANCRAKSANYREVV